MFDHEGMTYLLSQFNQTGTEHIDDRLSNISVLEIEGDDQKDQKDRYGGWSSFKNIYEQAQNDPPKIREQEYWFIAFKNLGTDVIDELHIQFEDDSIKAVVHNMEGKRVILLPVEVIGRHTNLTRTKKRYPKTAWYLTNFPGLKNKRISISIREKGARQSTPGEIRVQALPDF